jgi:hypothetical protein
MALTLEDLDRRVTALELAESTRNMAARSENAIVRLEQKVDAFPRALAEMIAESERRMGERIEARIAESEDRLREAVGRSVHASEQRMRTEIVDRIGASERRMIDVLNDRFDAVMAALDRPQGL